MNGEVALLGNQHEANYVCLILSDSKLSCQQQGGPTAEVCLEPVRWMFNHLDSDGNGELSNMELYEIEEIHNEHCIKPFLKACDLDSNKKVILKEFCQCLCVGKTKV